MNKRAWGERLVGPLEELILLAIQSQEDAYGVSIQEAIEYATEEEYTQGAVYTTLYRLEDKGMIQSYGKDSSPVRGGRSKTCYVLTQLGVEKLKEVDRIRNKIGTFGGINSHPNRTNPPNHQP